MKHNHSTRRALAAILVLVMMISLLPAGAIAAENGTIQGAVETIEVGNDVASARENNFNKGWKFYLGDNSSASNKDFDDSNWTDVDLPHDFSIIQPFSNTNGEGESGFLPGGTGWYRKSFTLSENSEDKTILLNFDGVYMHATVYVNGTELGTHHYGYTSFAFDISDYLVFDGVTENVVAVKAVNNIPSSRWYSGSGIYRDVELIVLDPVHVDLHGTTVTTPNISSGNGTVNMKVELVNDSDAAVTATVTNKIYAKGGATALATASSNVTVAANGTATAESSAVVANPALWSLETPNLYTVVTEVTVDGNVVDTYETEFGFRWFTFSSTGFALNGKNVKLNGVCMHHDQGALGSAAYYDAIYRQMSIMKEMGCNAIRTSHNPADEDFIAICNELGLLVIEETFDGLVDAKNSNAYDFSGYFEADADSGLYGYADGMTCAEYAARSNVSRDRNAPCIFAWSFGNEIQEGTGWGNVGRYDDICANYISWVNDEDGTRIVTSGDNNRGGSADLVNVINTITNAGGVAGFNYANSISTLSSLANSYGGQHGCIIASETASHTNSRGRYQSMNSNSAADGNYHVTSYDTSAVSWGITAHDSIYNTYNLDNVAGEFVWTGFDYIGEPTPWNDPYGTEDSRGAVPNSSYFGIVETTGFAKDSYYLYRAQWNKNATTAHLVTAWDSDNYMISGSTTPVWLYSNAPKVELYLNGNLIATATRNAVTSAAGHTYYTYTSTSNNSSVCTVSNGSGADGLYGAYNVVYTAGTLSLKAYNEDGTEITLDDSCGRYTVSTPGSVTQLKATANKTEIAADGTSLVYIEVDVLDANGNLDTTATNNITFTLSGNGKILGVDNGDQATTAKYQQSSVLASATSANINAYAGKALVIVRSTEEAGNITVNIASSGLTGQTVSVTTTETGDSGEASGLVSYTMIKDYTVKAGTAPTLDTASTGTMADGSTVTGTIAWNAVSADVYGTAGDYTITGTLTFPGLEPIQVAAKLHVIPNIIDLRNVSTATMEGVAPTLPGTVRGVMADGTLAGEFAVTWNAVAASEYDVVGEIVTVTGTAVIFGDETMDVTCTVRVAETVNTESTNVAPMADSLSQDVPAGSQSDNLNSILDGVTSPSDSESTRWTNWNYRYTSATATITLTWATAQKISDINLYYRYDSSCAHPESVEISYSLNGVDFVTVGSTESQITGVSVNYGAAYTYALDTVISPVALKVKFTQQGGTSDGKCVGLYEIECMTYAASLEYNTSADLSAITVDGAAIDGFAADTLAYETEAGDVAAETTVNAGITVLPVYEGVVRVLTVSEDNSAAKTYEVTLTGEVCDHANTELQNASAATCTTDGYTGDTYCNDCQTVTETGTVIPATGHQNTVLQNASAATCTADGYTGDTSCNDCKTTIATGSVIDATGHQHTQVRGAVTATCITEGYTGDTYCTDCGGLVSTGATVAVTDHSWDNGTVTKEATETENGIMTYTCTVCGATKTEDIVYQKELKVPTVTLEVTTKSNGRIVITGKVNDYENLDDYYEITGHGILYITTSRIGSRSLTISSTGRTRVNFSSYTADGSFTYNMKPSSKSTSYTMRAFVIYTNPETGKSVTVYSNIVRGSYNTLK